MNIEIAALSDAATDYDGRLCILGVTERLLANKFPYNHAQLTVVLRLRFHRVEAGQQQLRINLVDEDGHAQIPPIDANIELEFFEGEETQAQNFVLNLHSLRFEEEGRFSLDLAFNGRHEVSLPLWVLLDEEEGEDGLSDEDLED